ncbi:transglycosylase domain-containing protein [Microlunatus panaciterrae]|uniref:Membrane peptidoglycan carboxypeptidase n=1 Tax=Microlunatus panaciterrae TaxID=400768 RepID=A0ABS2RP69_9ACTN|nr:transglycosylase domain-containing protein [Microlunatus panaciterrae]MBM7799981.1 membrane peptidoglycan carboxypeptidase [Microlunatus panaciterrae]
MLGTPKRILHLGYALAMFLVTSVLVGVLVAGLVVPVAGLAGMGSRAAARELESLPEALVTPPQPEGSKILLGDGSVLAYLYDQNRVYVPLSKIAPIMRQAQLAIEDHRFYEHGALDVKATLRAFIRNSSAGGPTQGGSTITQQYVKMVQIEKARQAGDLEGIKAAQETTYARKIQELRYATSLEQKLNKDQILERYLNIAYYGDGAYGVEAAARHYFGISAAKLSLPQAAMLAGLVQNPDAHNPVRDLAAAMQRRDEVLNRMAELAVITPGQATAAKKVRFDRTKVTTVRNGCVGTKYPFLCQYVEQSLEKSPSLGRTVEDRVNMIKRGGLTVQTKIDQRSQRTAQKAINRVIDPRDPVISTMDMIQPGTGLIIAMAQSRPVMGARIRKGETYWNYSVEPSMGGAQGYQAGSTFKAFTAAAALEKGIPLTKKFNAQRTMNYSGRAFESCHGRRHVYGSWKVSNSTGYNGVMDMYKGTQMSVNNYYVQLELATGMCRVTKMAKRLGVKSSSAGRDLVDFYQDKPAFTLGSVEVSPMSMAEAYATFAARGIHCNPIIISKIITRNGKELAAPSADCKRVLSAKVADGMNKLLGTVMSKGTGLRARISDGRDQAGKTGTIDSAEAVWFVGYTPDIAGVAMISIDNQKKPFRKGKKGFRHGGVKGYTLPHSGTYLEGSGGGDAGMKIWKPVMEKYLRHVPKSKFKAPPKVIDQGRSVRLPDVCGMSVRRATKLLERKGFTVTNGYTYSSRPSGTLLGISPCRGIVREFSTIYIVYSAGEDPAIVAARRRAAADRARAQARAQAEAKRAAQKRAAEQKKAAEKKAAQKKAAEQKKGKG